MAALFTASIRPVSAQDVPALIPEDTLRSVFNFEEGAILKLSSCKEDTFLTCTYVWGKPSDKDAARANAGLKPEGATLMLIFAKAQSPNDFDRVLTSYSDAEDLQDLGIRSVWSPRRQQLSLITAENLIVHVNISDETNENLKGAAIEIANHILAAK